MHNISFIFSMKKAKEYNFLRVIASFIDKYTCSDKKNVL